MVLSLFFISFGLSCKNTSIIGYCDSISESNYFDSECDSGLLGCNAGGLECCRFCEFGVYSNVTCPKSPPTPPMRPPMPPRIPAPPQSPMPSAPPRPPKPCGTVIPGYCDSLFEPNIFDTECLWSSDPYGGLGCNAGGLMCCRFCGFGVYSNISCFPSPSPPPLPPRNPMTIEPIDVIIPPMKSKIEFGIRIKETIETFDKQMFKKKLRGVLKTISDKNIILRTRPGSVIVDVVLIANETVIENTEKLIISMNKTTFSKALNVSVIQLSHPVTTITEEEEPIEYIEFPLFLLGIVSFFCCNILLCCYYPKVKKFFKNRNTKIHISESYDPEIKQII
jgi:hypothetical protein